MTVDETTINDLKGCLRDLIATIELHTDLCDNRIDRDALEPYIERAEEVLGETREEFTC